MVSCVSEPTFSRVVIFADEKDSDCDDEELFADENVFQLEKKNKKNKNYRIEELNEWKRKSGIFSACRKGFCDPLGKFSGEQTCRNCRVIRDAEFEKLCFVWKEKEIFNIFLDYVYFRAILVFDETAEMRFAKENPTHPYFVNYKRIQQFNTKLLENVGQVAQFTPKMRAAIVNYSEICVVRPDQYSKCEICADDFPDSVAQKAFVVRGKRYRSSNFKFINKSAIRKVLQSREERIFLCRMHGKLFRSYFHLSHMDFLVHWNCYYRIQAVVCQAENLTAAEIIDRIDPYIFRNLVDFFLKIYHEWNKFPPSYNFRADCYFEGPLKSLVKQWKTSVVSENIDSVIRARTLESLVDNGREIER